MNREPEKREPPNVAPLKRGLDIPALPNDELPNRAPPKTEPLLRAAKLDSACDEEIAEFRPLEGVRNERAPEENPLEAAAPVRTPDEPANARQPVDVFAPRTPALAPELKPRPCVLPAPKPCHWPSAIAILLLAPEAPNLAFDDLKPPPRPPAQPEP